MRIWSLAAAVVILTLSQISSALSEDNKAILEGAQNFCAAKYGKRLLGVSVKGINEFSCRFAAVERTETYKIAAKSAEAPPPPKPAPAKASKPKWDLDEGEETSAAASSNLPDTAIALPAQQPGLLPAPALTTGSVATTPRKWKKRKWRKRRWQKRRRYSKRRRYRRKDPFAELFGKIGKKRVSKRRRYVRRRNWNRSRRRY